MSNLLDLLRASSHVSCDCMDSQVAEELGPFIDCTSNQAIAFFELSQTEKHKALFEEAIADARGNLASLQGRISFNEFVVEILMVKLQLRFIPHVSDYVHIQTNPKQSYSIAMTIENAKRLTAIFKTLAPDVNTSRLCIKVPATWEGLQACRTLEQEGIRTLATTMFCMEQAALASHVKCTYIAPYINELRVHFDQGFVDENKAFDFCRDAQHYYTTNKLTTQVLAASLTSVEEIMQLSGVQHITISPPLLKQLAERDATSWQGSKLCAFFNEAPANDTKYTKYTTILEDESAWKLAFTRSGFGTSHGKIVQAINYFSDFQEKIEAMVDEHVRK